MSRALTHRPQNSSIASTTSAQLSWLIICWKFWTMLLRIVRELEVAKLVGISCGSIGTQGAPQDHAVKSLLHRCETVQKFFSFARKPDSRAAVGWFFFRFTHGDIISDIQAPFVFFVIFNILWLT
jgi:hypothetical protein